MDFKTAMRLVYNNPAGKTSKAVTRPAWKGFVYYDATLFIGISPFGFRYSRSVDVSGDSYAPSMDDIEAEDWIEFIS